MAVRRNLHIVNHPASDLMSPALGPQRGAAGPSPDVDAHRGGLPEQPTPLLGRDDQLEALAEAVLYGEIRLLTLTGPAGVGKSRLAVETALTVAHAFPDGAVLIDLGQMDRLEPISSAIARKLGILENQGIPTLSLLVDHLSSRRLLLVLDNFEHSLTLTSDISEIAARCPRITMIITSREPLHLRSEHVQPIAPLPLPDSDNVAFERLEESPCIDLFMQRAQAIRPDFTLTPSNAPDIREICRRLDGLPLAIELAAARINVLTPSAILRRLATGSSVLHQAAPDVPLRHRSLDAALESSYSLLSEREKSLLRQVAVFVDGFTLDAAAHVISLREPPGDILEDLATLVDKSLVVADGRAGEEVRFRLLQTIESYAVEQPHEAREVECAREAHAAYFLDLAEQAARELSGPRQHIWFARMDREYGNLMAALDASADTDRSAELRMTIALTEFWRLRGRADEGAQRLSDALSRHANTNDALRVVALDSLGEVLRTAGKLQESRRTIDEGICLAGTLDAPFLVARLLKHSALLLAMQGEGEAATAQLNQALALWEELQDAEEIAFTIRCQGIVQLWAGAPETAEVLLAESLAMFENAEDFFNVILGLLSLAHALGLQGKTDQAARLIERALSTSDTVDAERLIVLALELAAWLAAPTARVEVVGRLLGAINATREASGFTRIPDDGTAFDDAYATVVWRATEHSAHSWMAPGMRASFEQTIEEAHGLLSTIADPAGESRAEQPSTGRLSKREYEVLQLVAGGFSNKQIAQHLVISENTAKFHVTSILNKLGADSRARLVALAAEFNLLQPSDIA